MSASVISKTIRAARRAILTVMVGAAVLICGLIAERLLFERAIDGAAENARVATSIKGTIQLLDEQLTMSANMAAATGDMAWGNRYDKFVAPMDEAIAKAKAIASPELAARFDKTTKAANDVLIGLETEALAAAAKGDTGQASQVLGGATYAEQKAVLAAGSDAFLGGLTHETQKQIDAVKLRGRLIMLMAVGLTLAGIALLFRRINRLLKQYEATYLAQEARIRDLAVNDTLTGLPNRRAFMDELGRSLARADRQSQIVSTLIIDLDRFKPINDRHGHLAGDAMLIEVARRLKATARRSEFVARLGGDEFALVMTSSQDEPEAPLRAAQRIIAALRPVYIMDALDLSVGATVGFARYPVDSTDAEDLLRKADVALYRAKNDERGTARPFDEAMDLEIQARARTERDIKQALAAGQIIPYFQPLVDLPSGKVRGFEVLARWDHPEKGILPPAAFLSIAEEAGLMSELTLVILEQACRQAKNWTRPLPIAVNIAPEQLQDAWLPEKILQVLANTRFPANRLEIELTENALIEDFATAKAVINYFKSKGIRISLDDFGTGYSSLCHLSELPFDKIKIDQSFIRSLENRPESAKIVQAIIGLGQSLGLPTIAEGVETAALAARLTDLGCPQAQGYLYAKPMSGADLRVLIDQMDAPDQAVA
jgi:diguanylate cyclase (GGDEF)-like protein